MREKQGTWENISVKRVTSGQGLESSSQHRKYTYDTIKSYSHAIELREAKEVNVSDIRTVMKGNLTR